jgi:hypothetical protein
MRCSVCSNSSNHTQVGRDAKAQRMGTWVASQAGPSRTVGGVLAASVLLLPHNPTAAHIIKFFVQMHVVVCQRAPNQLQECHVQCQLIPT